MFDHPLKLPEAAVSGGHQAGGKNHENPDDLHSQGDQGVQGARITASSAFEGSAGSTPALCAAPWKQASDVCFLTPAGLWGAAFMFK